MHNIDLEPSSSSSSLSFLLVTTPTFRPQTSKQAIFALATLASPAAAAPGPSVLSPPSCRAPQDRLQPACQLTDILDLYEPDSNLHANPQNASMPPHPNPPSIEAAYKRKCIALKKRLNEVEAHNEAMRLRNAQGIRYIQKMRLESCMMLERLSVLMGMADGSGRQGESEVTGRAAALMRESGHLLDEERSRAGQKRSGEDLDALGEESDGSSGHHPPTPQERPLRPKRSRKSDERPAGHGAGDSTNINDAGNSNSNMDSVDHHHTSSANPSANDLSSFPPATSGREPPHRYVSAFEAFTNYKRASLTEALVRSYGQRVTDEDIDRALVKEWDALDPAKKREFGERLEKENGV